MAGVRVPAILVSPWIPKGTIVDVNRVFEHASIPATVTKWLLPTFDNTQQSPGEDGRLDLFGPAHRYPAHRRAVNGRHASTAHRLEHAEERL